MGKHSVTYGVKYRFQCENVRINKVYQEYTLGILFFVASYSSVLLKNEKQSH